jgi:signal-transduction protein with cAMP-binding, CBS, and nucleotidyltransferase domain
MRAITHPVFHSSWRREGMNTLTAFDRRQTHKDLFEFMLSTPEFNVLTGDEMGLLDRIMLVNNYASGHKFKSTDNIYLLIDGEVDVLHQQVTGALQREHIHMGEFFDLFSLIKSTRRYTKCIAVGTVRTASLPREAFELICRSNMPLSDHFRHIICRQILRYIPAQAGSVRCI